MSKTLPFAVLLLGALAAPAFAAGPVPVDACVDLSADHQGVRFGSQYLLLKDGDTHYRVGFGKSCGALSGGGVRISTNGEDNRLCPSDTTVSSKRASCAVKSVESIDAATFERYKRRR